MNNHQQATLPLDIDDILIDTTDPSAERRHDPQPPDHAIHRDDPDPTYPKADADVLRPGPSSEHTLAASPHGEAAPTDPKSDGVERDGPFLVTIPDAGRLLGVGRTTMYELIGAGEVEVVHIGRAARIPVDSIEHYVGRLRSVPDASR